MRIFLRSVLCTEFISQFYSHMSSNKFLLFLYLFQNEQLLILCSFSQYFIFYLH